MINQFLFTTLGENPGYPNSANALNQANEIDKMGGHSVYKWCDYCMMTIVEIFTGTYQKVVFIYG